MSRFRDRLLPALAAAMVLVVALAVVLLLRVANQQGTDALGKAKLAQVRATADSFNARVASALTAVAGLGAQNWALVPGNAKDTGVLKSYATDPNAASGLFLVNSAGTVVNGVLLEAGALGRTFKSTQWQSIKHRLAGQPSIVLPVSNSGLTTQLPEYEFVVAIRGSGRTSVRGALVFESALTPRSAFESEIRQLGVGAPSTAAWFFTDSRGTVVATTQDTGLGKPIENRGYLTARPGQSELGSRTVFAADVPSIGWRVVFRQSHAQFVEALSGPLQRAGLILVLLLMIIGLTLVALLMRRLHESREQARRLQELNRSQAEFVSVVSHELRTPVAGILGFLQTTVDHWDRMTESERMSAVRRAMTNARRLQAMTRDVLTTETLDSGRLGYTFQRVDLATELRTAVEGSTDIDPTHPVQVLGPDVALTVDADADRLQQVLANLLENARKNSPAGELITVEATFVDGPAPVTRVAVVDRGPGISPDSLERVFEKFVRGNDNAVTGTGLGLYIVRMIVEAHHGRIWCESAPGDRTAFIFELPATRTSVPARVPATTAASR